MIARTLESQPPDATHWNSRGTALFGPGGCEATEGLQATGEVVGRDEVGKMLAEVAVAFIVEAPDSGVLDGAIHAFDLAIRLRVPRLDVRAVVGEHGVDLVGNRRGEGA